MGGTYAPSHGAGGQPREASSPGQPVGEGVAILPDLRPIRVSRWVDPGGLPFHAGRSARLGYALRGRSRHGRQAVAHPSPGPSRASRPEGPLTRQFLTFMGVWWTGAAMSLIGVPALVESFGLAPFTAQLLVFIPVFAFSFMGHLRLTFRRRPPESTVSYLE